MSVECLQRCVKASFTPHDYPDVAHSNISVCGVDESAAICHANSSQPVYLKKESPFLVNKWEVLAYHSHEIHFRGLCQEKRFTMDLHTL